MGKPLHQTLEEWSSAYERLMVSILILISPVALPIAAYALVRIGVEVAALLHWTLGLGAAAGFVVLAEYLRRLLRRQLFEKFPTRVVIIMFGMSVLAAISAFAAISYYLTRQQIGMYEIRADYSIGTFADYYVWIFVDMLPGLDVWKTLGVSSPASPRNVVAGLPVLAFRLFVVLGIFASYKTWQEHRNASKGERTERKDTA